MRGNHRKRGDRRWLASRRSSSLSAIYRRSLTCLPTIPDRLGVLNTATRPSSPRVPSFDRVPFVPHCFDIDIALGHIAN